MLFRPKKQFGRWDHVRETLWPRKGYLRPLVYRAKCALRLQDNAHRIAIGVACGTFVSFTPFMGLHIVLALAFAWMLSGNLVASALGTAVGNPLTFPPIWLVTHRFGTLLMGRAEPPAREVRSFGERFFETEGPFHHVLINMWEPLILPMMVGGIPLGILAGATAYALTRTSALAFQEARQKRRDALAKKADAESAPKGSATA